MPDMIQICSECNRPIEDQYIMRVADSILHEHCLRCFTCGNFLTESCFSKFGQYYCRQDFYRQFGPRCAGCQLVFTETEKVRKIDQSFFHGHCFKCSVCSKDLTEAEKVGCDQNGNLLCETDFLKNHCDDLVPGGGHSERLLEDETEKKEESNLPSRDLTEGLSEEEAEINKEVLDDPKKNGRKRGPKTTIKPHQLELLKNVFDQNPKPTPKVFEELSKDTGLSKRVIQVWFQNKRSKSKRINKMQSLISLGQSFTSPMPGLPFPPGPWDPLEMAGDFPHAGYPGPVPGMSSFSEHGDSRGYDRSGYPGGYPGDPGDMGYPGSAHAHIFPPTPGNCFPSPPSQPSDFPGPGFPPPVSCSLSSFPSPDTLGPGYQD